jgi:DNA-binding CsgD family transcriptional regulator
MAQGVIFVTGKGRVIYCNAAAEKLLRRGKGLALRCGRLSARDPATQQHLWALLQRDLAAGQSLVVRRGDDERPLIVWAAPLPQRYASAVAPQPTVMLLIRDPAQPRAPATELLSRLYRLTPAEARLARALAAGGGLRQAAASADMSYETARWYLKVLFQKTHTGRQVDLVARLLSDVGDAPLH